jgi:hypothetical protein
VIAAHIAVDICVPGRVEGSPGWLGFFLLGIAVGQVHLIAAWLVFARQPFFSRVVTSVLLAVVVWLAIIGGVHVTQSHNGFDRNHMDGPIATLIAGLIVGSVLCSLVPIAACRLVFQRWRSLAPRSVPAAVRNRQIELKRVMIDIMLCCACLAVARLIVPRLYWSPPTMMPDLLGLVMATVVMNCISTIPPTFIGLLATRRLLIWGGLANVIWSALVALGLWQVYSALNLYVATHGWLGSFWYCLGQTTTLFVTLCLLRSAGLLLNQKSSDQTLTLPVNNGI